MRIPIPERFSAKFVVVFISLFVLGQQIVGTDALFSLLTAIYLALFFIGCNVGGGILYTSGAFIFFNGMLTAIVGLAYKTILLQPGEKYLLSPNTTMLAYCCGMFSMVIAVSVSNRLRPKRGLLADVAAGDRMKQAAIGCFLVGAVLSLVTANSGPGTLGSALREINRFPLMAILFAITWQMQRTNGKSSTNWVFWAAEAWLFALGAISFSKEGMFTGPVIWVIATVALGYNFSKKQIVGGVLATFVMLYYLIPYSQYVRNFRVESRAGNLEIGLKYLVNLNETRRLYDETLGDHDITNEPHLFGAPQGFLDRINMLAFDDALINYTDQGNVFGVQPTFDAYSNIVPHFIWKDKPVFAYGNLFGRQIGVIDENNTGTGISFSPAGDAYHEAQWFGVLIVWPLVAFLFFYVSDSLAGNARDSPWALLSISIAPHAAPEGMLGGIIFLTTYGIAGLLLVAWFVRYVLPLTNGLFGGERSIPLQPRALADLKPRIHPARLTTAASNDIRPPA